MMLFEKENFTGCQWEINDDYPSLQAMGWGNNEIGSMQVQGGWYVLVVALPLGSFFLLFPKLSKAAVAEICKSARFLKHRFKLAQNKYAER